jgi:hypothetical protein
LQAEKDPLNLNQIMLAEGVAMAHFRNVACACPAKRGI